MERGALFTKGNERRPATCLLILSSGSLSTLAVGEGMSSHPLIYAPFTDRPDNLDLRLFQFPCLRTWLSSGEFISLMRSIIRLAAPRTGAVLTYSDTSLPHDSLPEKYQERLTT